MESDSLVTHVFTVHEDEHSVEGMHTVLTRSDREESSKLTDDTYSPRRWEVR